MSHPVSSSSLPRWPAVAALFCVGALNFALPETLSVGPRWLLLLLVGALAVPTIFARRTGRHDLNQRCGLLLNIVQTAALIGSVALLVFNLPRHTLAPGELLRGAAALWITNVLVFAQWSWRLDAGGPHLRDARPGHSNGAYLFPQMTLSDDSPAKEPNWSPDFVDYLFLSFSTSTAFSATDAPVLSRWAKIALMIQALISLIIISLLAARAVNIL